MDFFKQPQNLLFVSIVATGTLGFIGLLGVASETLKYSYPYGKYISYSIGYIGNAACAAIVLSVIFGIALVIFWYLGAPSSPHPKVFIFRICIAVCIVAELIANIVCCHYSGANVIQQNWDEYADSTKMDDSSRLKYLDWRLEYYTNGNAQEYIMVSGQKYTAFLCINIIFAILVVVYFLAFRLQLFQATPYSRFPFWSRSKSGPFQNQNNAAAPTSLPQTYEQPAADQTQPEPVAADPVDPAVQSAPEPNRENEEQSTHSHSSKSDGGENVDA